MNILLLKLIITPTVIGAASLAGRRWGAAVSGWLIGLPFTSAPVAFFLALSHGTAFATDVVTGTLAGGLSLVMFFVTYHFIAMRYRWPVALAGSLIALGAANFGLQYLRVSLPVLVVMVVAALAAALWIVPEPVETPVETAVQLPAWDIPARMVVATTFVLWITAAAEILGPRLSGLISTFPLIAGILMVFAHHQHGAQSARRVIRGLLAGLFGFVGFYTVLITTLQPAGIAVGFAAAIITALAIQGVTLLIMKRRNVQTA